MLATLALALAVGLALGALTGLPLGIVNVAIVEAAARRGVRAASGIAVGGAIADGVHAALAFGGVGGAIVARPAAATVANAIAGVVLPATRSSCGSRARQPKVRTTNRR